MATLLLDTTEILYNDDRALCNLSCLIRKIKRWVQLCYRSMAMDIVDWSSRSQTKKIHTERIPIHSQQVGWRYSALILAEDIVLSFGVRVERPTA